MDEYYNKHYITVDDAGRILSGWSDGPHPDRDTTGAVLLTDKGGYQFRLWPDGDENPMLADLDGIPLYKLEDGYPVRRTEEELETDRAAMPEPDPTPTMEQRITTLETSKANQTDVDELTEALDLILSGVTE